MGHIKIAISKKSNEDCYERKTVQVLLAQIKTVLTLRRQLKNCDFSTGKHKFVIILLGQIKNCDNSTGTNNEI